MRSYAVVVRNLPEELRGDTQLRDYFKDLYDDTHDAIAARDIGKLVKKVGLLLTFHPQAVTHSLVMRGQIRWLSTPR